MFRQIVVVTCDFCGKTEEPRVVITPRNEMVNTIPNGWTVAPNNHAVHLCPVCSRKLEGVGRHG